MKCGACGYEKGYVWNENDDYVEINHDGENFTHIEGHFTVTDGSGWDKQKSEVELYACPKCNTIVLGN